MVLPVVVPRQDIRDASSAPLRQVRAQTSDEVFAYTAARLALTTAVCHQAADRTLSREGRVGFEPWGQIRRENTLLSERVRLGFGGSGGGGGGSAST